MRTEFWSNSTGPLGAGVEYTIFSRRSSSLPLDHPPPCKLMDVFILNNNNNQYSLTDVPCFSCSDFACAIDYFDYFRQCLTHVISTALVLPTPFCAAKITEDVLRSVLHPANDSDAYRNHRVDILVQLPRPRVPRVYNTDDDHISRAPRVYNTDDDHISRVPRVYSTDDDHINRVPRVYNSTDDDHINRVINESFEEAGPQRKPATLESIINMVMARAELEALEGEKVESGWVPSENKCAICIDDIEKPWESLTSPCSHIFHEMCLVRWLGDNHVCPLCRFELPCET